VLCPIDPQFNDFCLWIQACYLEVNAELSGHGCLRRPCWRQRLHGLVNEQLLAITCNCTCHAIIMLLDNGRFLTELLRLYQANREKGSVWVTMKRSTSGIVVKRGQGCRS
jgi:hypothetical protein